MHQLNIDGNMTHPSSLGGLCCAALLALFGEKVSLPGSVPYNDSLSSYWSSQAASVHPACVFSPRTADDVSTALRALTASEALPFLDTALRGPCQFAVRSGGHTSFAGAASIEGGVTIDLSGLNSIEVSLDKSTVSIGVGARWQDVYAKLDPFNLSAVGGRNGLVGVGGLTTGGGISHFSPRYGFACDTVSNYQVVLADGSIVDAESDPDLLFALRGGSNNFGIVTRVDLQTFDQGLLWGGQIYNPISTLDSVLKTFADLNSPDGYDEYASLITAFGFSQGMVAIANDITYTKNEANPPVLQPLTALPSYLNSMRITNMTSIAVEMGTFQPDGLHELYASQTLVSSVEMLEAIYICFNKTVEAIQDIPGIVWSVVLEPLPQAVYKRAPPGSNALGLSNRTEPLLIALVSATWQDEVHDERINNLTQSLMADIEKEARKLNAFDSYVYLPYAAPWQDPMHGYGEETLGRLQRVKRKVDPDGIFTYNVPGGFKIPM
ncbi:hypothetical protein O1611_g503 [Lasiodiplodia mahajangana]|uniref:Uncharacterized protein n=1 Tax=Lasiodiplodia mahajangana TaxID=1108764 RepID=A0ACC2K0S0_9PEZI|nr:hypothetical protein O1611_g503 [Lasiodiplodia mahajangana]